MTETTKAKLFVLSSEGGYTTIRLQSSDLTFEHLNQYNITQFNLTESQQDADYFSISRLTINSHLIRALS